MSRIIEKIENVFLVALVGEYRGDIAKAPGLKEKATKIADISRYRLFHVVIPGRYFLLVSQGKESTDPRKIIITCFGKNEQAIESIINNLLAETGIKEIDAPLGEREALIKRAKELTAMGALPEWLRKK